MIATFRAVCRPALVLVILLSVFQLRRAQFPFALVPVCANKTSLREISENKKLAREYALLGNYSSASILYQGLLEQIRKYLHTVHASSLKQRWQQVWQDISEENKHVLAIMSTLESFKLETAAPSNPSKHDCDLRPEPVVKRASPCPGRKADNRSKDSKTPNNRPGGGVRVALTPRGCGANGDRGKPAKGKDKKEAKEAPRKAKDKNKADVQEREVKKFDGTGCHGGIQAGALELRQLVQLPAGFQQAALVLLLGVRAPVGHLHSQRGHTGVPQSQTEQTP